MDSVVGIRKGPSNTEHLLESHRIEVLLLSNRMSCLSDALLSTLHNTSQRTPMLPFFTVHCVYKLVMAYYCYPDNVLCNARDLIKTR